MKGTLEPGKLADVTVIAPDPTRVPPGSINDIAVEMTVIGGAVVYERLPAAPAAGERQPSRQVARCDGAGRGRSGAATKELSRDKGRWMKGDEGAARRLLYQLAITLGGSRDQLDPRTLQERLRAAEDGGVHCVWVDESWGPDAITQLALAAAATRRVQIGSAIATVFSRTPAALAQHVGTLDIVSGGACGGYGRRCRWSPTR